MKKTVEYFRCPYNVKELGEVGVQMKHKPSGAVAQACDTHSRETNEVIALERLQISHEYRKWKTNGQS